MMMERYVMGSLVSSSGPCSAAASKNRASPAAGDRPCRRGGTALAGQHVDELDASMLEHGVGLGFLGKGDEIRLDHHLARDRMPEQLVLVAGLGAAPLDGHTLPCRNVRAIALLLVARKECRERHVERAGQRLEAVHRGRHRAVFDLGEHPRRQACLISKLGAREVELAAEIAHLVADQFGNGSARRGLRRDEPVLRSSLGLWLLRTST